MKHLLLSFSFILIAFSLSAQTIDTATVRIEIDSLIELNRNFIAERQIDQAYEVIKQAEKKCKQFLGQETTRYALINRLIGLIYYYKSDYEGAKPYWVNAKNIYGEVLGKEHVDYANSLINLGLLYSILNQTENAETLLLESITVWEKLNKIEHPNYAKCLNNLGLLYKDLGQYEKTEPLFLKVKDIRKKVFGKEHENYANIINNLGNLYMDMGEFPQAELHYLETKDIWEKVLGKEHPNYGSILNNLGNLYKNMGQLRKAEKLYLEAFEIWEKVIGREHENFTLVLNNLGNVYFNLKEFEKAKPYYIETREIREKILGKENALYATCLNSLGLLYKNLDQHDKAESYFLETIEIREKIFGKDHIDYGLGLSNLGRLYYKMNQFDKAKQKYSEAIEIVKTVIDRVHPDYSLLLGNMAVLLTKMEQYEHAKFYYSETNSIESELLLKSSNYLSEREMASFIYKFVDHQDQLYSFARDQKVLVSEVYDNALFYKGFLLNAMLKLNRLAKSDSLHRDLFIELKAYNRLLAKAYSSSLADRDSASISILEEQVNTLSKKLTRSVSGYEDATKQVNWIDVQNQLKPGEAALEFINFPYHDPEPTDSMMYCALLLQSDFNEPLLIPLFEEASIRNLIAMDQERRADYVNNLYAISDRGATVLSDTQKNLYDLIWAPILTHLPDIQTIYFSPSGLLHRINLNAIPVDQTTTISDHFNLVQLNSTRALVTIEDAILNKQEAVIYGGIQYDFDSLAMVTANETYEGEAIVSRGESHINQVDSTLRGGTSWKYLNWTKNEMEDIQEILLNNNYTNNTFSDYLATEESFKNIGKDKSSPQVIHLATHGFFFPDPKKEDGFTNEESVFKISDNPMIRSGVLLAGANHVWQGNLPLSEMEDGILTAFEISQMDLSNTELVVLSACETGLGDIEGNEGVYGLQRAFKIAGVKHLIMSLWQVPDRQTKDFMVSFYKHWLEDELTISEAFNKTQEQMKNRFYDPYLWAGFVLLE